MTSRAEYHRKRMQDPKVRMARAEASKRYYDRNRLRIAEERYIKRHPDLDVPAYMLEVIDRGLQSVTADAVARAEELMGCSIEQARRELGYMGGGVSDEPPQYDNTPGQPMTEGVKRIYCNISNLF